MGFKLDLHVHTESFGRVYMDEKSLEVALRIRGLDGIAVTNFANISHAFWLRKKLPQFLIIVGQEIWSSKGHIGALGITRKIADFLSPKETIRQIHDQGGLAVAVHPFLPMGIGELAYELPVDLVESYNGMIGAAFFFNLLAGFKAWSSKRVSVSSSDTTALDFIGQSRIEVLTDDTKDVLSAIQSGKLLLTKRALPVPFGFILRNFLGARNLPPCRLHAAPCFLCGNSMAVKILKRKVSCIDCHREEFSRISCSEGHFFCIACVLRRISEADDKVNISAISAYHGTY
ncbi:MAG: PHP domain-containing protein [Candidatus Omnitrophica bacterium]|nr:PHP domain-containing protein [Candidatus Omnitrophota bacterium]